MKVGGRGIPGMFVLALSLGAGSGCRSAPSSAPAPTPGVVLAPGAGIVGPGSAGAIATADRTERSFTPADAEFMAGMIPHHAQAVTMAQWAATHGARADVRLFSEKVIVAQRDEIRLLQGWLRERGLPVPDSMATRHVMRMGDMTHQMLMPGMLSDDDMATLDAARGQMFDPFFLTSMIRHHQGAIQMVEQLFGSSRAAQDHTVFRFASDVVADQSAEIERMQAMLETIPR
jgi:uncharacterized protein (DUF305 family)